MRLPDIFWTRRAALRTWQAVSLLALAVLLCGAAAAGAQEITATLIDTLNVRAGPGQDSEVLTKLPVHSQVILEGRSRIGNWMLVHTPDGSVRGWVATRYLMLPDDFDLAAQPVVEGQAVTAPPVVETAPPTESAPVSPGGLTATTVTLLNVRSGPGVNHDSLTKLERNTVVGLEGRDQAGDWVLINAPVRGWVSARYLALPGDITVRALPVVGAVVTASAPAAASSSVPVSDYEASLMAQLSEVPVIPAISSRVREIYRRGKELGNNPHVFAKVGDCNSESHAFMGLIGTGSYNLGSYSSLQTTISFFSTPLPDGSANPFIHDSMAAKTGYLTTSIVDPIFGDPRYCGAGQSPLECEYSRIQPSAALIMLGVADVQLLSADLFEQGLRKIVDTSISRGVIPVLTTFPSKPHESGIFSRSLEFNLIIVRVAREYDIPLINLWLATQSQPEKGIYGDLIHVTYSGVDVISFTGDEATWGFTRWNLVALQTLEELRKAVLAG